MEFIDNTSRNIIMNLINESDISRDDIRIRRYFTTRRDLNLTPIEIVKNLPTNKIDKIYRYLNEEVDRGGFRDNKNTKYIRLLLENREVIDRINPKTEDADELLGETSPAVQLKYKTEKGYRDYLFHLSIPFFILEDSDFKKKVEQKQGEKWLNVNKVQEEQALAGVDDLEYVLKRLNKVNPKLIKKANRKDLEFYLKPLITSLIDIKKAPMKDIKFYEDDEDDEEDDEDDEEDDEDDEEDDDLERRMRNLRNSVIDEGISHDIWDE